MVTYEEWKRREERRERELQEAAQAWRIIRGEFEKMLLPLVTWLNDWLVGVIYAFQRWRHRP